MAKNRENTPFPLRQYYTIYGGLGGIIFYVMLFVLFINAEQDALYGQYIQSVQHKAESLYQDVSRDFLEPRGMTFEQINPFDTTMHRELRNEIDGIVTHDFALAKVKIFSSRGITLYDHTAPQQEGLISSTKDESTFLTAMQGTVVSKFKTESGRQLLELYLPIFNRQQNHVVGILELYEDVSRFKKQLHFALKQALLLPTLVFIIFNIVLFLIVTKADRIIAKNTRFLVDIRRKMEKYLSPSAVNAIYHSVSTRDEIFQGERQEVVVFFSDVRGFTRFAAKQEPEVVVEALNRTFELQAEIIHRHGGVIDKFIGDSVMALFPGDNAGGAVQAALAIIRAIAEQSDKDFRVGIGIHRGSAVVGSLGTKDRRDYTAIGDTVNIGARLCGAAGTGEIILSAPIFQTLELSLQEQFSQTRTLQLKGKDTAFNVYFRKDQALTKPTEGHGTTA
ncbi:MAG: adenylate/guanylate cyclase domain-containing protein [Proteobacteria bacterium]|nr:adenylate/guanylate cyclase domain-containing protein [Pseudomonadota bacterium]MBU1688122.1 adenylate/guanylate cyclase domain-containing protein [Pseudomonadota bacterium]